MNLILKNFPLSSRCFYGTGGPAAFYAEPKDRSELVKVLSWANDASIPVEIIGGGANLLISDSGYNGLVICMSSFDKRITVSGDGLVSCGAGTKLRELVRFCSSKGYGGISKLAGIPGTVGGAVRMNAGAYGREIKETVSRVTAVDFSGVEKTLAADEAGFGYRRSSGLDALIITGVLFKFEKAAPADLKKETEDILTIRKSKQPLDKPSCGSVFKRPEGAFAGDLIEKCGLKGLRKGGAVISEKHSNFIVNDSGATSSDIKYLMDTAAAEVKNRFGIILEPEVKLLGFD